MIHVDAPQSGYAGHQATYVPIFFTNDSNESFLRGISASEKIAAQERFDFDDSKTAGRVNQIVWSGSDALRHEHRQCATMDTAMLQRGEPGLN
ncbi:hypothetical protein [Herbaspirillum rhizosphaerae]|uniref:hypothetical protein n=1 Tax=Herbaspirillum rhizosphaerae TaxID=346179 RepID=UPI00142F3B24|nr:hypothetical protein [Herbaspirillum rhizosphaerae]